MLPLAVFLYRDYGFLSDEPAATDAISVFREEFGYAGSTGTSEEEYGHLYQEAEDLLAGTGWFEEI